MPKYRITDPSSGRIVTVSGPKPPSQQDAEAIFGHVNSQQEAPAPVQQTQQAPQDKGNALTNFLPSLGNAMMGIVDAGKQAMTPADGQVQPTPVSNQLTQNLGRMALGGVEKIIPGHQEDEKYADAVGKFYGDRYGSVGNTVNTFQTDPVGMGLDVATVLDGGASILGKAGDVSKIGALTKAGEVAKTAGAVVNPIESLTKLLGLTIDNPITRKLQAPFKSQYDPEAVARAKELGVELPVSAKTKSGFVRGGEALSERGTLFGGKIQKIVADAHAKLDSRVSELTNRLVNHPDFHGVGSTIQEGFTKYQDDFKATKTAMYDNVPDAINSAPANLEATQQALHEIIDQKGQSLVGNEASFFKDVLGRIETKEGVLNPTTVATIKQTRQAIGAMLKDHNNPLATGDTANLRKLYATLSDDLDTSIANIDPEVGKALSEANKYYKDGVTKINSKLGQKIKNADPEKLVDELIKPNSETSIEQVKEIIGEEATGKLQEAFLNKLYSNSVKDGVLDIVKLDAQLGKYGDATLQKLFSNEQYLRLKAVREELAKVHATRKDLRNPVTNGSQTAMIGNIGFMGSLATQPHLWPILAKIIIGQYGASKMYTSPKLSKLLLEGLDMTSAPSAKLKAVAPVAGKAGQVGQLNRATQPF